MNATQTVQWLLVSAVAAAEWQRDQRPRRLARAQRWWTRKAGLLAARDVAVPHSPMHKRAALLAHWADRRAQAWEALADGDEITARALCADARQAFAASQVLPA
jgi:hypothetical protein